MEVAPLWRLYCPYFTLSLPSVTFITRRESKEAAAAAAPVKSTSGPGAATISSAADNELQQRLKQRQSVLDAEQQEL